MKAEITRIRERLRAEIHQHNERGDFAAIAQLAPKLKELELMEAQLTQLASRISSFQNGGSQKQAAPTSRPAPQDFSDRINLTHKRDQTRLKITIRWRKLGRSLADEILEERFANRTQAKFLGVLIAQLGSALLGQLKQFSRVQGGRMHVSDHPETDPNFINQTLNVPYAYKPIPGTDLSLLTNTSTSEKKNDLESFLNFARLPEDAFEIQIIEK